MNAHFADPVGHGIGYALMTKDRTVVDDFAFSQFLHLRDDPTATQEVSRKIDVDNALPGLVAVLLQRGNLENASVIEHELKDQVQTWRLAPVVEALQALRGVQFTIAVTTVAELGDLTRFDNPRQLRHYLGLTPSEYSTGERRRQGGITKTGNTHARRALIEGAWASRSPATISRHLQLRLEKVPKLMQDMSWKAQVRLCKRYRQLSARGKNPNQVVVAIARELSAFMWAIAQAVPLIP